MCDPILECALFRYSEYMNQEWEHRDRSAASRHRVEGPIDRRGASINGVPRQRAEISPERREELRARRQQRAAARQQQSVAGMPPAGRPQRSQRPRGTQQPQRTREAARSRATRPEYARPTAVRGASSAKFPSLFGIDLRLIAAALLLVVLVVLVVRGCSAKEEPEEAPVVSTSVVAAPAVNVEEYRAAVYNWLGDDYTDQLLEAAKSDEDAAWIIAHTDEYAVDGESIQYKMLKLAATEPVARKFVRDWPERYSQDKGEPADATWEGVVPHFYQWDQRWGYTVYCNTTFAATGCCPTSMAMVVAALSGSSEVTPYDMGVLAQEWGYMDAYNGTDTGFVFVAADHFGLNCEQISTSVSSVTGALAAGQVLICNVGPGDFTTGGHFIVLTGLDANGDIIVNDPYSAERSAKTWDPDNVMVQTKALFAFSRA